MKRKNKEKTSTIFQPSEFFLDDLEHFHSIISETMDSVSIENSDYEFENVSELVEEKSPPLTNIEFIGYQNKSPKIFLFIDPWSIYIRINKDEPSLLGTVEKIKEIIKVRKRRFVPSNELLTILTWVGVFLAVLSLVIRLTMKDYSVLFFTVLGISLFLNIPISFLIKYPKNKINLTYSKLTPSFWKRNSDTIVVAVITSILTLIISYIFRKVNGFIP